MQHVETPLAGRRIAVIGGAGFIGHHIALKLKELGAEPHIFDSLQVNNLGAFTSGLHDGPTNDLYVSFIQDRLQLLRDAKIPMHIVDARDYHMIGRHLDHVSPHAIVHLAAVAHANRANKDPYNTFDHSLRTLENVLDSVRVEKPHFIYFSSSMVYGNFDGEAVSEDRVCEPIGIYGALKFAGEKLVKAYNQVFDLPYTIIRPSALYGERCVSRRVGQAFIENALRGVDLTINGDGTDRLDFTYIDDLVQGVIASLQRPAAVNEIFNITYGEGRSLLELAEIVRAAFPNIKIQHNPRSALMPERGTLSIAKAKELLGYAPANPIEVGFKHYMDWYRSFHNAHPEIFSPTSTR